MLLGSICKRWILGEIPQDTLRWEEGGCVLEKRKQQTSCDQELRVKLSRGNDLSVPDKPRLLRVFGRRAGEEGDEHLRRRGLLLSSLKEVASPHLTQNWDVQQAPSMKLPKNSY